MEYQPEQFQAITASPLTPLCIFAGPGSGKTSVIVERLKHLASSGSVSRCLVLSFSKAAAKELTTRLQEKTTLRNIEVSTFHSFSYRIVLKLWPMLGFATKPTIVKASEIRKHLRTLLETSAAFASQYKAAEKRDYISSVLKLIAMAKTQIDPETFLLSRGMVEVVDLYRQLNALLRSHSQIAFSDMVLLAYHLLHTNEQLTNSLRELYDHILVDEYQDTNEVQNGVLLSIATRGYVTIVGDTDQLIYAFQGANKSNLKDFFEFYSNRDIRVQRVSLKINYRSAPAIVTCGNLIANAKFNNSSAAEVQSAAIGGDSASNASPASKKAVAEARAIYQRKEMIATESKFPYLQRKIEPQNACVAMNSIGDSSRGSSSSVVSSNWSSQTRFYEQFPLGIVVIAECLPSETAQYEFVSYLIEHMLCLPQQQQQQRRQQQHKSSSSSADRDAVPIIHEICSERIAPNEFAILFRKNENGIRLKRYLRNKHRNVKINWHKIANEEGEYAQRARSCPLRVLLAYLQLCLPPQQQQQQQQQQRHATYAAEAEAEANEDQLLCFCLSALTNELAAVGSSANSRAVDEAVGEEGATSLIDSIDVPSASASASAIASSSASASASAAKASEYPIEQLIKFGRERSKEYNMPLLETVADMVRPLLTTSNSNSNRNSTAKRTSTSKPVNNTRPSKKRCSSAFDVIVVDHDDDDALPINTTTTTAAAAAAAAAAAVEPQPAHPLPALNRCPKALCSRIVELDALRQRLIQEEDLLSRVIAIAIENAKIRSWYRPSRCGAKGGVHCHTQTIASSTSVSVSSAGMTRYSSSNSATASQYNSNTNNRRQTSVGYLETEDASDELGSELGAEDDLEEAWRAVDGIVADAQHFEQTMKQRNRSSMSSYCKLGLLQQLSAFLEEIRSRYSHLLQTVTEGFDDASDTNRDAINLGTIHSAKGREWRVVLLIDGDSGSLPGDPSNPQCEDERNLAYVAASRAKERFIVSYVGPTTGNESASLSAHFEMLKALRKTGQVVCRSFPFQQFKQANTVSKAQLAYVENYTVHMEEFERMSTALEVKTSNRQQYHQQLQPDDAKAESKADEAGHKKVAESIAAAIAVSGNDDDDMDAIAACLEVEAMMMMQQQQQQQGMAQTKPRREID